MQLLIIHQLEDALFRRRLCDVSPRNNDEKLPIVWLAAAELVAAQVEGARAQQLRLVSSSLSTHFD
ncbi:MAG: hypothetical protein MHM6MM_001315 [Cercozoa sp. M6MM]